MIKPVGLQVLDYPASFFASLSEGRNRILLSASSDVSEQCVSFVPLCQSCYLRCNQYQLETIAVFDVTLVSSRKIYSRKVSSLDAKNSTDAEPLLSKKPFLSVSGSSASLENSCGILMHDNAVSDHHARVSHGSQLLSVNVQD